MPKTPDRNVATTEFNEESIYQDTGLADPTDAGTIRYRNTAFRHADGLGIYDPRTPWANIVDGPFSDVAGTVLYKTITGTVAPSSVNYYADSAKTKLVAAITYTYAVSNSLLPVTIVQKLYNSDGSVRAVATDQISYSGAFESSRTRTFS